MNEKITSVYNRTSKQTGILALLYLTLAFNQSAFSAGGGCAFTWLVTAPVKTDNYT